MKNKKVQKNIVIYQAKSGAIELRGDFSKETIWATQAQIVRLFNVDQSVVSRHIKNIFKDGEIDEKSNMQKMHNANSDKPVSLYSLDVILGIGYRTNSRVAIEFRRWATKTLREHITQGFTLNRSRIKTNYEVFLNVVKDIQKLLPQGSAVSPSDVVELISLFADTWLSLDAYDKENFPSGKLTRKNVKLTAQRISDSLAQLKQSLLEKEEITEIFGKENSTGNVAGIIGNVMQTFNGKELYPTVEEKASHLLYFMIKNHPFIDGNKRSGAFVFVWFLRQANILDVSKLTPSALTALTIMVAESNPKHKEKIIALILNLISKK